jgi:hypothetical protein
MKDWILELCPEIAEWQAEMIAKECRNLIAAEREACLRECRFGRSSADIEIAIRARGEKKTL